jgi:hypothetical protein
MARVAEADEGVVADEEALDGTEQERQDHRCRHDRDQPAFATAGPNLHGRRS